MQVTNELFPSDKKQIQAMQEKGPDGPIYMVNLLKFKDKAVYADGRKTKLSGREAYALYGQAVSQLLAQYEGELVFVGDVTFLSIGQAEELWDEVAIARYPNRAALVAMSSSEAWRAAAVHRTAGLKGQLNIETVGQLMPFAPSSEAR